MNKKVAILQSNYIPWKGYFDLINMVDEFILYDDMQYTRRDWRNRNIIKTSHGLFWLTIPVLVKGKFLQKIKETEISNPNWNNEHWKTIMLSYTKAPYFLQYKDFFEELYAKCTFKYLSEINYYFLTAICKQLGINTKIKWSDEYILAPGKTERLVDICKQAGATEYLSGPSAKNYIDSTLFEKANIKLTFMEYNNYPEYNQLYPPFEHGVSIVDLILQTGEDAAKYMKSFKRK